MAFRASNIVAADAYQLAKRTANNCKAQAERFRSLFSSTTDRQAVIRCWDIMVKFADEFDRLAATPGIGQYAKDQENDPLYDVVAEFTAMTNAVEAVITEIEATFPTDAGGHLAVQKFGTVDGARRIVGGTFTAGQLAALRTDLDAVIASIS